VKGDEHASNNVYFVVREGHIEQRYYDGSCITNVTGKGDHEHWPARWELSGDAVADAFAALFPGRVYSALKKRTAIQASGAKDHQSAAELFTLARPDDYVYHRNLGWYALLPTNAWEPWGKERRAF
jgi:hypothetical protein